MPLLGISNKTKDGCKTGDKNCVFQPVVRWGHGPFVAFQNGTDQVIQAIGIRWMVGCRRDTAVVVGTKDTSSWNLGLGIMVDPKAKVLDDGFNEDEPPPGV